LWISIRLLFLSSHRSDDVVKYKEHLAQTCLDHLNLHRSRLFALLSGKEREREREREMGGGGGE